MKIIFTTFVHALLAYLVVVAFTLYGVAMGFIPTDSSDAVSNSIRFIYNLF